MRQIHAEGLCILFRIRWFNIDTLQMGWMKERYERDFVQHLLPAFPYEMHRKAKKKKDKSTKNKEEPQVLLLLISETVRQGLLTALKLLRT